MSPSLCLPTLQDETFPKQFGEVGAPKLGLCLSSTLVTMGKSFPAPQFFYQHNGQRSSPLGGQQGGFAKIIHGESLVQYLAYGRSPTNANHHHPSQSLLWFLWALGGWVAGCGYLRRRGEHLKRISNLKILERLAAWEVEGCPVPTPVIPTTCWPQSEGSERQHPAGQRCGDAEQGNGVGRAETRDPFPLQRHKIPGKPFL